MDHKQKLKLRQSLYKDSYYDFFVDGFKVLHPNQEFVDNWHVAYLCDKIQKAIDNVGNKEKRKKHLLINIPPRTLKSMIDTIYLTPYAWTKYPSLIMVSVSYSGELSLDHNMKSRTIIQSDWYGELFPEIQLKKDQNQKSIFENTSQGVRFSTSTGGGFTGKGADIIMIDDLMNPKIARSDLERQTALTFFKETLQSRFNNPSEGLFIVVEQRLHENDLSGYILENLSDEFEHVCLPVEISEGIKPTELSKQYIDGLLFPDRLSRDVINKFKVSLGSYGYAGQYLQEPAPVEGGIIKKTWLEDNMIEANDIPDNLVRYFYADTSYGDQRAGKDPDDTAIGCWSYYKGDVIIWKVKGEKLEFNELVKHINSFLIAHKYNFQSKFLVEPKASGKSVVQYMKSNFGINIYEDKPPTESKISRIQAVSPFIEAGRVKLVEGDWNEEFINQVAMFPNAKHDDMVDVLSGMLMNTDMEQDGSIFMVEKNTNELIDDIKF